jgi:hypothetical protein
LQNSQVVSKGHVRNVSKDFVLKPMCLMANYKAAGWCNVRIVLSVVCHMLQYRFGPEENIWA